MAIRFLDSLTINQIAAGEVVERPSSVVKELIENSLDAGATEIIVTLREGGKTYISIQDNGSGMDESDLSLCVERHATSKIADDDLFNIKSLGFRGEALAAVSAVARVTITTRQNTQATTALQLCVSGGTKDAISPAMGVLGTHIEVRDLFYATPARLKFLKSTKSELSNCLDMVERLALSHLGVGFRVLHNDRILFEIDKGATLEERLTKVIAHDIMDNSVKIDHAAQDLSIKGYIGLTTYNASQPNKQYFFVNRRPVKDKLLHAALKIAYRDYLSKDRYPVCALFLTLDPALVDINVHPAKIEVRFMQGALLRDRLISLIHGHLKQINTTSSHLSKAAFDAFQPPILSSSYRPHASLTGSLPASQSSPTLAFPSHPSSSPHALALKIEEERQNNPLWEPSLSALNAPSVMESATHYPLGHAVAQLFKSYIISQTEEAFYLTDQHAAAERVFYESLKKQFFEGPLERQLLLLPEIVEVKESDKMLLLEHQETLRSFGLSVDIFGVSQVIVKEIPALLKDIPVTQTVLDIISDLREHQTSIHLKEKILEKLATKACHGSIRFGRKLSLIEMDALLREIEGTAFSTQCNHGRPSFIKLSRQDLEKLFERT